MHLASLETSRKGSIYLILILIYVTTCLYWNLHCGQTARYIWKIFRQLIENNIAFHLIPSSHSATADWVYSVLGIIDIRMYSCAIMPTHPHMASLVKEILPKNGSLKLKNISSADSKQYCLSLDTPQPFSRRSLCIWRCWKHREKVAYTWFWFWNMAQPVYIETFIAAKRLVIFEKYFVSRWKTILPFIWYPAAIQPRQIGYMAFLELSILGCILAQSCQHIHIWQEFRQRYIAEKRLVKIEIYFVSRWQTILPFTCYPAAI